MRPRTYQGAVIASQAPRGVHYSEHRSRTGVGVFVSRTDFELVARVIAAKRKLDQWRTS
jgi:hypothetical protein